MIMTWMRNLDDNKRLNQIVMPGSHDAAMYETNGVSTFASDAKVITQNLSIADQLDAGCRFFDLRVYNKKTGRFGRRANNLYTGHFMEAFGHGKHDQGAYGPSLATVLDHVSEWIQRDENDGETVILRFSHIKDKWTEAIIEAINAAIPLNYRYRAPQAMALPMARLPIGPMRGKVIIACTDNFPNLPLRGIHRFYKYGDGVTGLITCGKYSNTNDYAAMRGGRGRGFFKRKKTGQGQYMDKHNDHQHRAPIGNPDHIFILYWTLTGGNIAETSVPALAGVANDLCGDHGLLHGQTFTGRMPNVVLMDFINDARCQSVYGLNTFP